MALTQQVKGSTLHIGFIAHEYPNEQDPGRGLASYVQRIGRLLVQRGHRVTVIVPTHRHMTWQDKGVTIHELLWPEHLLTRVPGGVLVSNIAKRTFLRGTYPSLIRLWAARRVAHAVWDIHRTIPFDVIQSVNNFSLGFALRNNGKIPLITRISNYQPLWRSADNRHRLFSAAICDWFEVKQVIDSDASFAPSEFLARAYARLEAHQMAVIPTPIDPPDLVLDNSFYKERLAGKKYLLYFSALSRIKGADLLADAMPSILPSHPDLSVVFIGEQRKILGRNALDVILEKNKGFEDHVIHFAPIPKKLLFPVIQHALAVVIPSRTDNFPNVCLEAQAMGKIVIATRDSSLEEMVSDGTTGFLAENGDVASLQTAIERLLNLNEAQRLQMEDAVRAHAQSIYEDDRVGKLEQLYLDVVSAYRAG